MSHPNVSWDKLYEQVAADVCKESFEDFVKEFWPVIIPEALQWNWHMSVVCQELQVIAERVFKGESKEYDLLCNIPPGSSKSSLCSVMYPAWIWTRMPSARIICSSYSHALSLALSMKCRDVLKSEKYKSMFNVQIKSDQDQKHFFKVTGGGERYATSTGGSVTGFHGHFIICDDPINLNEVFSSTMMNTANNWLDQSLLTRKVSKDITPFILIQQRLSETDPTAHFIEKGGCRHICLPAEENNLINPPELKANYIDGLLDINRMPKRVLDKIRIDLGDYGYAGQFLQSPAPIGGGMFQVEKIQTVYAVPGPLRSVVRYWDKAGTANAGCFTVGLKMGVLSDGRVIVLDVVRGRWGADERERIMRQTAMSDGVDIKIYMETEPGSGGKESSMYSIRNLAGFNVEGDLPRGDKAKRADPYAAQMGAGNVLMLKGHWNNEYTQELSAYPNGRYVDQIDASSGAFNKMSFRKRAGVW